MNVPKFNENDSFQSPFFKVLKIGERYKKGKSDKLIFECFSYILEDKDGNLYYFLEDELNGYRKT